MPGTRQQRPIEYRDRHDRVWSVAEVAVLKVVSPAIDGPNVALVIRFEREGEERLARWIGGDEWVQRAALDRLFAAAEPAAAETVAAEPVPAAVRPAATPALGAADDEKRPEAPIAMRLRWIQEVAEMGPDALEVFEQQTFQQWDRASLVAVRRAIDARRRELAS
jgi:hypothetical protein